MSFVLVACALGLDLILGDPRGLPHPVVYIGRLIRRLEGWLAGMYFPGRIAGVILCAGTLVVTALVSSLILSLGAALGSLIGALTALIMAWSCLALRGLHRESSKVIRSLDAGDLEGARFELSMLVSRDCSQLDEQGVLRALIETVSENSSDGVIAPLFYLFLGGPALAMIYKAASTLDSMVGYKNEKYRELGWASARLDDLLNLVPSRLTGLLFVAAAWLLRLNSRGAWRLMLRDARKTASPNAGFPESAAAGALGIQLGGDCVYFGRIQTKPTLGDDISPLSIESYRGMIRLLYLGTFLALLVMGALQGLFL